MKVELSLHDNGPWTDISDYIAFGGLKRNRNDVDGPEAGRTMEGEMVRARVTTKLRYDVTCRPLTTTELNAIETLIMPEYIYMRITDPYYGTVVKHVYSNNTSAAFLIRKRNGTEWWNGVTFPLIEV